MATGDNQNDDDRFERPVNFGPTEGSRRGFIDLYRKDCFILEGKQGVPAQDTSDADQLNLLVAEGGKTVRTGHGAARLSAS